MATAPKSPVVYRSPRLWPFLSARTIAIPQVSSPTSPSATTLIVSLMGLVGLAVSAIIYLNVGQGSGSSVFIIGFLAISGLTTVGSLLAFLIQVLMARRDANSLDKLYRTRLTTLEDDILIPLALQEIQARRTNDSGITRLGINTRLQLWQRQTKDPDFLMVRLGTGYATPQYQVQVAETGNTIKLPPRKVMLSRADFSQLEEKSLELARKFRKIPPDASPAQQAAYPELGRNIPVTLSLIEHPAIALIDPNLTSARQLANTIIGHTAFHHAYTDVEIMVFSSVLTSETWEWSRALPHTLRGPNVCCDRLDRERVLSSLLARLLKRENALGEKRTDRQREPFSPHIVVVIDAFVDANGQSLLQANAGLDEIDDTSALEASAIRLALRRGRELGITVISLHATSTQAPVQTSALVSLHDANATRGTTPGRDQVLVNTGIIRVIKPMPPEDQSFSAELYAIPEYVRLGTFIGMHELGVEGGLEIPEQVQLLSLMEPSIPNAGTYPIRDQWTRTKTSSFSIPLGVEIGLNTLKLDFLKDGPHGLLIGQTGSGKSELLRAIIAGLAISYSPDEVNFVLVDYKGGLELRAFEQLPHTVAFLTNMVQAGQTNRFLSMLRYEIEKRQRLRDEGKNFPRLFVVIDEFAEMVSRKGPNDTTTEVIIENLLSIVRLGRALKVHLLFAAQRPETSVIQRLRGYVQYRICLRTNTPEDSREVIGRPDAAELPTGIPGRGYLLHGDNELIMFQAARIAMPYTTPYTTYAVADATADATANAETLDEVIAGRMAEMGQSSQTSLARPWPQALPASTYDNPSPLVLFKPPFIQTKTEATAYPRGGDPRFPMRIPLGLIDRPTRQQQDWFHADLKGYEGRLTGGPLLIMGDLNAGKSTALQTTLLALAAFSSQEDLRCYVIDPSRALENFQQLPHFHDPLTGELNLIDGLVPDELAAWKKRFEQAMSVEAAQRQRLLLVIDDYDELARSSKDLQDLVLKVGRAREQEVYLIITASKQSFEGMTQQVFNIMATRIYLYMNDRDQLRNLLGGRLPFLPDLLPGRGFVQTRQGFLDEIQIAVPVPGSSDEERDRHLQQTIQSLAHS